LQADVVSSEETRTLFVQQQLYASGVVGPIEMLPYLERLGAAVAASMIRDARPITLKVVGVAGSLSARQAESVGLIATELVMNALKHAFPDQNMKGRINVAYDVEERIGNRQSLIMELASRMASLPKQRLGSPLAS
jgi:two-component sensor histidine kinase